MEPATAPRRRRRRWEIGNDRRHHTVRSIVGVAGNGFDAAGWQANGLEAKRSVEVSWGEGDFWCSTAWEPIPSYGTETVEWHP